ncbi:endonuclease/exonuclease/phosphatase family protein [Pseudonocardia sp. HH130630-07]|uniref:endonuclease/exonuclease/phosphatase family protein n=1 Tax=Pseudonocardia sp. HH130630-07 TaxID=1690815 RepID=UPI000814D36B|nr:endonuclease/exonuclease/phosphatase family protein [Pseudonocardia sp. HH130630-07]ANY07840.1 hypothetical protein AFB00_17780 [Pseudonocardia sp. HH130630-07]
MSPARLAPARAAVLLAAVSALFAATLATVPPAHAATTVKALSLNVWVQGTKAQKPDPAARVAATITTQGADVVALQETNTAFSDAVAAELGGWSAVTQGDVSVLSREAPEDTATFTDGATAASAKVGGVWYYSVHLSYDPYAPYELCDGRSPEQVDASMTKQTDQAKALVGWARSDAPQVILGDFNSPSGLDWVEATKDQHCGVVYDHPTMRVFADAGWTDTYRVAHPDPAADPGITWSTDPQYTEQRDRDRIDYVLTLDGAGQQLSTTASEVVGDWADPDWISDHYGVLTTLGTG